MSVLYGNWNLDSLKQYGYFSAKLYLIYEEKKSQEKSNAF